MNLRGDCWCGEAMNANKAMAAGEVRAQIIAERSVTILGATGSIGASTIDLIKREPQRYRVEAVTANKSATALATLARELGARFAAVGDQSALALERENERAWSGALRVRCRASILWNSRRAESLEPLGFGLITARPLRFSSRGSSHRSGFDYRQCVPCS